MGKTPTSLKVLGILGIIFGSLALLGTVCGTVQLIHPLQSSPAVDALMENKLYVGYAIASTFIGLLMGILLLASSIGCLKCRRWARTGMNVYACIYALLGVVQSVIQVTYVGPTMSRAMAPTLPPGLPPGYFEMIQIIGAVVGILIATGIVATILIIVNRRIAVDAFNGIFPADPTSFPMDYPPPPMA